MTGAGYTLAFIAVVAGVTVCLRALPFFVFRKNVPGPVRYLGTVLPAAIMGMLVVYCLKNVSLLSSPHAIPEAAAVCAVVALHKWKHNVLLSVLGGTVVYMLLVQLVF